MKKLIFAGILAFFPGTFGIAEAQPLPFLVGGDGSFLGVVSPNRVDQRSICNPVGNYGSRVGNFSMRNKVGDYGNQISELSAYNPRASYPPLMFIGNDVVGIITTNRRVHPELRIDPELLFYTECGG